MQKSLPRNGQEWGALDGILTEMTAGDADWRRGRVPRGVNFATESVYDVSKKAFAKFLMQHANAFAFPGIARMENEVIEMALDLFHAPEEGCGNMTTGGSESIFLAIKACRDWTRSNSPRRATLNIVVPYSAQGGHGHGCRDPAGADR
jgi:glutamate/tyrosine decarboxylase-like PLP-dependent enzyme